MKFRDICFIDCDPELEELNTMLEEEGSDEVTNVLSCNYDYGEGDIRDSPPWGSGDSLYRMEDYVLIVHPGGLYIGLCQQLDI